MQNLAEQKISRARELRGASTDAERKLWKHLRNRQLEGMKFRRQVPLFGFYADFFCESANVVVELDGGQHSSQTEWDVKRTKVLQEAGILVLRFWNNEVIENIEGVLAEIVRITKAASPHPVPLPMGEGTVLQPERQ
ncbi:MAG: endonuclease domain-containing protein [Rhodomicrobium sp.]